MTTIITGYTAEHMDEIEAATIVGAHFVGNLLVLERHDGDTIDVGLMDPGIVYNRVTGDYTLALTDVNKCVEMNDASPNDLIVPAFTSVAFSVGDRIDVKQRGTGLTTIVASGGVQLNSLGGLLDSAGQYATIHLENVDEDEWYVWGDLA